MQDADKMIDFFDKSKDNTIYKKTHCLCINELNLCIINKNSDKLKQIYDGCNYKKNDYCSFICFNNNPKYEVTNTTWQHFEIK